jgi:pimeloyl-ACP methyl ester carboxylesterase
VLTRRPWPTTTASTAVVLATALLLVACSTTSGTVTQDSASTSVSSAGGDPSSSTSSTASSTATASAAPTPSLDPALAQFYGQTLVWTACGGGFQCSRLTVPLDYADPTGDKIRIALIRLRAGNPSARLGSLVINPGGPGASGVDFVRGAKSAFDAPVRARYDIVGFDPRGVARSAPVVCLSDKQTDEFLAADGTPTTPDQVATIDSLAKGLADGCKRNAPKLFAHISTVEAVKDVDILREALGDSTLNWFGFSYGTLLGTTYADLFPTRVGRMVLDGVIDPSLSNVELAHGQAKAFEVALHHFIAWCDRQRDCPLPKGDQAGIDRIQGFLDSIDGNPLQTADPKRPLTQALAMNTMISYLYFPAYGDWDQLLIGLQAAFDGDGSTMLSMLDDRTDRNESGHYADNFESALYAVSALDRPDRPTAAESQRLADMWAQEAPVFGAFTAWGILPYQYWSVAANDPPHEIHAPGSPKILVVGTTSDPATPYPWAQSVAKQLSQGVLLTRVGDGHTGYGKGSRCTDSAIDRYLLTGATPPVGTVCH